MPLWPPVPTSMQTRLSKLCGKTLRYIGSLVKPKKITKSRTNSDDDGCAIVIIKC